MSICPFYTRDLSDPAKTSGCIVTCELRVEGHCALSVLAQKAIYDARKAKETKPESPKKS